MALFINLYQKSKYLKDGELFALKIKNLKDSRNWEQSRTN